MAQRNIPIAPSANIAQVVFDDETGDLIISFVKGSQPYRYAQVPANIADGFTQSPSPGRYFRTTVLNQYQHDIV